MTRAARSEVFRAKPEAARILRVFTRRDKIERIFLSGGNS